MTPSSSQPENNKQSENSSQSKNRNIDSLYNEIKSFI